MSERPLAVRARAVAANPWLWVGLVYASGIVLRAIYTFQVQPAQEYIRQDMSLYVSLAQRLVVTHGPTEPWEVMTPLGYPMFLSFLLSGGGSLARAVNVQFLISCLLPPALGLLGAAAYGRRTAMLAVVFASLYFPFIEYGALFLTELPFIFTMTLSFTLLFAATRVRRRAPALAVTAAGGALLSLAATFKSVALPAAFLLAVVEGVALWVATPADGAHARLARLAPWVQRWAVIAVAATPLLGLHARTCTRANDGKFCLTGNKVGADLLLGHYGRLGAIEWTPPRGGTSRFGSPGSYLRRYEATAVVPFDLTDNAANSAEAWRWISKHPGEAAVLSIDHVYDAFFGAAMWPGYGHPSWPLAHLSQYAFIAFLFIPLLPACAGILRRGARAAATSRTAQVLAPVAALAITVAIATGEVRYRIPFDTFMIVVVCAHFSGDLRRIDGPARAAT